MKSRDALMEVRTEAHGLQNPVNPSQQDPVKCIKEVEADDEPLETSLVEIHGCQPDSSSSLKDGTALH